MSFSFRKTHIIYWSVALILGLIFSAFRPEIVPEKYYNDSNTYEWETSLSISQSFTDNSKENTVYFYQILGLDHDLEVRSVGIISFLICFFLVLITFYSLVDRGGLGRISINFNWFLSMIWIIMFSIYISQYTKEFHAIIFTCVAFLARVKLKKVWGIPISWGIIVFYSSVFRSYWVILWGVLELTQVLFYLSAAGKLKIPKARWLGLCGMLLSIVIVLSLFLPEGLSSIRYTMNENRDALDSASRIPHILVPGSVLSDLANTVYAVFCIGLPFYFVAFGGLLHKVFTILFFITLVVLYKEHKDIDLKKNSSLRYSLSLLVSFFYVQVMFVPDLGALLRHTVPFTPFLLYGLIYNEKN